MNQIIIQKYDPQRDKAQIERMLLNYNHLLNIFYNDEKSNKDNILVALNNTSSIGFLSFNGFGRKPQAILYVNKEHDAADIGSMLIQEYEKMLIPNEKVEHTLFTCSHHDTDLISLLDNNGYRLYLSSYIMERKGESFPSDNIIVRNYEENDYFEWDRICELAFFHMRQRIGLYPSFL